MRRSEELAGIGDVTCDLRIIRVDDGTGVGEASARCKSNDLEGIGKAIAGKLRDYMAIKGEPVAVLTLRNRSESAAGRVVTDEVAGKVANALIADTWFDVKERINLRGLIVERDLETADIVNNPKVRPKLAKIKYVVIGGVTLKEESP